MYCHRVMCVDPGACSSYVPTVAKTIAKQSFRCMSRSVLNKQTCIKQPELHAMLVMEWSAIELFRFQSVEIDIIEVYEDWGDTTRVVSYLGLLWYPII